MFLKDCEYNKKEKKLIRHNIDHLKISSDDSDDFDVEEII